jgi:hypothetical protein
MKVILNVTTSFEGKSLKPNDITDIPLNVAQRWISKGIAHPVKEEIKPAVVVKEVKPKVKKEKKIKEAIIFREPEIKIKKTKKTKKVKEDKEQIATSNYKEINEL